MTYMILLFIPQHIHTPITTKTATVNTVTIDVDTAITTAFCILSSPSSPNETGLTVEEMALLSVEREERVEVREGVGIFISGSS